MKRLVLSLLLALSALFMLTSCKEISPKEKVVIYNGETYRHIENWKPIDDSFDSVKAYFGKENKDGKANQSVYVYRNCDEKFISVKVNNIMHYYHKQNDTLPNYQDIDTIEKICLVSIREEIKFNSKYYKPIIEHITANKENSYIISGDSKLIGDIVVFYKDYPAAHTIGNLVYDEQDNVCFSDIRLASFEDFIWVYPFPFEAH